MGALVCDRRPDRDHVLAAAAEELYNVSEEGVRAGLGRALVFLNYPVSLIATSIAWLSPAGSRLAVRSGPPWLPRFSAA